MKNFLGGVNGEDNYFINYSDGEPWFSCDGVYYHGRDAEKHTQKMVKTMKNNGIKVITKGILTPVPKPIVNPANKMRRLQFFFGFCRYLKKI